MSKTKKKKKHRLFWHFFRIQLVLLVLVLTAAAYYFYGGYGKQVEELKQEAVGLSDSRMWILLRQIRPALSMHRMEA